MLPTFIDDRLNSIVLHIIVDDNFHDIVSNNVVNDLADISLKKSSTICMGCRQRVVKNLLWVLYASSMLS